MDSDSLVKSSNGITSVSLDARLLSNRIIYIDDQEITEKLIANIVKKILVLVSEDSDKTITIIIDSCGGSVKAGMVLYDILQTCKTPIRMVAAGRAYSMAAILLAAGKHGRYILPNSEVMIHQPLLGSPVIGNSSSIKSVSDKLNKEKKKMNQLLATHTGKTEKQIEKATSFDHFFSPEEAIAFGLCDAIIGFDEIMED